MLEIRWTEKITYKEVLDKIMEQRQIWISIQCRRGKMIGHILRHESLLNRKKCQRKKCKGTTKGRIYDTYNAGYE